MPGRKRGATASCTRRVSMALHVAGFWTFALRQTLRRHLLVRLFVHENGADALVVLQHGHAGMLRDASGSAPLLPAG